VHRSNDQRESNGSASGYSGPAVDEQWFGMVEIGKGENLFQMLCPWGMGQFAFVEPFNTDDVQAKHRVDAAEAGGIWHWS
jgi:hypothetical protein